MESYEMAKMHFEKLGSDPEGQQELSKYKETMQLQFDLKDDESFYIEINNGKASVTKGTASMDPKKVITLTTDKATVRDIFHRGQLYPGLADFLCEGRLLFIGWEKRDKPTTAWAQLLRMHV